MCLMPLRRRTCDNENLLNRLRMDGNGSSHSRTARAQRLFRLHRKEWPRSLHDSMLINAHAPAAGMPNGAPRPFRGKSQQLTGSACAIPRHRRRGIHRLTPRRTPRWRGRRGHRARRFLDRKAGKSRIRTGPDRADGGHDHRRGDLRARLSWHRRRPLCTEQTGRRALLPSLDAPRAPSPEGGGRLGVDL
jgi:hypothetical protein